MKILQDSRLSTFKRIEHLLEGWNYSVWLNLYGPSDSDKSLIDAMRMDVSNDCDISDRASSSPSKAAAEILGMLYFEGDDAAGPIELESKKPEILELLKSVFSLIELEAAYIVTEFSIRNGHPAYPVYWDFAYDIHSNGKRWIFIGSSSD